MLNRTRMARIKRIVADYICVNPFNPCSSAFYFFFALLFVSCSSSVPTTNDLNSLLSNETAKSQSSQLSVRIPNGWFTAADNQYNSIDLWLIKNDYSETLNFVPLNIDSKALSKLGSDKLTLAVQASKDFKMAKYGRALKSFSDEKPFELNQKQFAAYKYTDDEGRDVRVVVFEYGSKFYEVSAIPMKTSDISKLYRIQDSVLNSIK